MSTAQTRDAQHIAAAYDVLAGRAGDPVDLLQVYYMVDMTKQQFHAALESLLDAGEGRVLLENEPRLRRLTAEDHEIAIQLGGEPKHTLSILQ